MRSSTTDFAYHVLKCAAVTALLVMFCAVSADNATAQNPANAIEASGIQIPENPRLVVVEPDDYPLQVGNLNRAVETQLTDDNTIFVLQRDGVYWTDSRIENENYRLHIKAEEGEGHPPIVRPALDLGVSTHPLHTTQDVILEDIFFLGINEDGVAEDVLKHFGENTTIVVDNCWFIGTWNHTIEFNGSDNAFYMMNSIAANGGGGVERIQFSRFITTTGNPQTIIYYKNNTFYNIGHSLLYNSGGLLQEFIMDHNTVYNLQQYIRVGEAFNAYLTNNIFTNVYTIGQTDTEQSRAFIEIRAQPEGFDEDARNLVIRRNNIGYLDEAYLDLIEVRDAANPDLNIMKAPNVSREFMDPNNDLPEATYTDNIEERIEFEDPPDLQPYLDWTEQWMHWGGGLTGESPDDRYDHTMIFWDRWEETPNEPAPVHFTRDLLRDFTYSSDHQSYTWGDDGYPLGDLNWFPDLKERWIAGEVIVGVEEEGPLPETFRLVGNYPNPFNPSTEIVFEMAAEGAVKMDVFTVLGQKVKSEELGRYTPGRHQVTFNAGHMQSGIYLVRLSTGPHVQTVNVVLLK